MKRRNFIRLSALSAAALTIDACKKDTMLNSEYTCVPNTVRKKCIIIGSGFGGSITAHRLTEAGHETLMLERGKFYDTTDGSQNVFAPPAGFTMQQVMGFRADKRSTFLGNVCANPFAPPVLRTDKYVGVMERVEGVNMTVIAPAILGGGTALHGGIFVQPEEQFYYQVFPSEISYADLDSKWFPLVKQNFNASKMPTDIAQHQAFLHQERFKEDNLNAGIDTYQIDVTYDWNKIRDEINGTRYPGSLSGESMFGTSSGARNSAEHNYLKWAQDSGKLEIKTQCIVTDISKDCENKYLVYVNEIDEVGRVIKKTIYNCDYLFMCAGSVNTSKLMVKAKEKGLLNNLNDEVGKGWGHNGSAFVLRQSLARPTGLPQGFPPNYAASDYQNPIAPLFIEHLAFPMEFECDCLSYFGIGLVKDFGYFRYDKSKDDATLIYQHSSQSYQKYVNQAMLNTIKKINDANGGYNSSIIGNVPKSDSSAHPCGGMVIGKATDFFGRVKNHHQLYVLDGALLPGCSALTNPAMTISALVERNIENILNNDF